MRDTFWLVGIAFIVSNSWVIAAHSSPLVTLIEEFLLEHNQNVLKWLVNNSWLQGLSVDPMGDELKVLRYDQAVSYWQLGKLYTIKIYKQQLEYIVLRDLNVVLF